MSFIGIVCEAKNNNYVKKVLEKYIKNDNVLIFNEENVENFKNIKFETIIIITNDKDILCKKDDINNIINKASYLIINSDEEINLDSVYNENLNVITYGFNSKSTITTSSIDEENLLLCIQRNIVNIKNEKIESQEISIKIEEYKAPTHVIMGLVTLLIIYGIKNFK